MKKLLLITLLISSYSFAEGLKIAVIEGKTILAQSEEGQKINETIANKRDSLTQELMAMDQKLEKEANELRSKARTISQEALEAKQEAFYKAQRARENKAQEAEADFKNFANKTLAKFDTKLRTKLASWAEKNGLDVVSLKETGEIIYASKTVDYTKQLIDVLDTEYKQAHKPADHSKK